LFYNNKEAKSVFLYTERSLYICRRCVQRVQRSACPVIWTLKLWFQHALNAFSTTLCHQLTTPASVRIYNSCLPKFQHYNTPVLLLHVRIFTSIILLLVTQHRWSYKRE